MMRFKAACLLIVLLVLVPSVLTTASRALVEAVLRAAHVLLAGFGG